MLGLQVFRSTAAGMADLLNWAALVDDGIVQGKDGSLIAGYFYQGPDSAGASPAVRNYLTERVNAALVTLGSGWASWHDAVRMPATDYPDAARSAFPDPITAAIDAERRRQFQAEGTHYESEYALILSYLPPLRRHSKLADLVYDDDDAPLGALGSRLLEGFKKALADIEDGLRDVVRLRRMTSFTVRDRQGRESRRDDLLNYLQFSLTGQPASLNLPASGMYLDALLGGQELWPGDTPRYGDRFIACVAIEGFPSDSYPGLLEALDELPIAYRWSTRMIYLDHHEAVGELKKYRRKWRQRIRGFWSQMFRTSGGIVDEDALLMAGQAETAINEANSALVRYGFYTPVIVLMQEDRALLEEQARLVVREIQRFGFVCRIETVNTMEAWLGSLPGHGQPNIRRPMIHTLNLADLLPLSSVWPGHDHNPCPFYPDQSPALLHGKTAGATPFRLNLHFGDLGHFLVFGPTGAGKSVLLAMIAAQFRRYPNATLCAFDKGRSLWTLVEACGGRHYDIAADGASLGLAPLAVLEGDGDLAWAEEWIETCVHLQSGHPASPAQREEIHRAMLLLADPMAARSLTDFVATVQDGAIRQALAPYTLNGPYGHLLDSRADGIAASTFSVFELEELMALGDKVAIPILLHLFRRFEKSLTGQPALLLLDEAWLMLAHPVFREKIREWLKVLRKANCAVGLATQSLSDAVRSGLLDVLLESCPTKILLPNEEAAKDGGGQAQGPAGFYRAFGLNDQEIEIVRTAVRKRQYYYVSPEGRRLFELGLGPVARAFVAVSDKETLAHLRQLKARHGARWPAVWLEEQGVSVDLLPAGGLNHEQVIA
jgi:type IV secretion system protein VirB4